MAGRGKTLGSGTAKKAQSRSSKAGLQFPVGRTARFLEPMPVDTSAKVFLAAVGECVVAEVLEVAGSAAKTRIEPRHIQRVFKTDRELGKLVGDVTIPKGGVLPNVHDFLLPKKTGTSKATGGDDDSEIEIEKERAESRGNCSGVSGGSSEREY